MWMYLSIYLCMAPSHDQVNMGPDLFFFLFFLNFFLISLFAFLSTSYFLLFCCPTSYPTFDFPIPFLTCDLLQSPTIHTTTSLSLQKHWWVKALIRPNLRNFLPWRVLTCLALPCLDWTSDWYAMSCHVMSCHAMLYCTVLYCTVLYCPILSDNYGLVSIFMTVLLTAVRFPYGYH